MASRGMLKKLKRLLEPKAIAVVGASGTPGKVGNVITRNLIDGKYDGGIYPVNPKYKEVLGLKCYGRVTDIRGEVDSVIVATPAAAVPGIMKDCAKKKVGGVVVLSGGFEEVGRKDLADAVKTIAERGGIPVIGPNCLGIYNPYNHVDSIFFPMYKLGRPGKGGVSFITQSGAVGSVIIDAADNYGLGIAKFISYGNATVIDETDLLEYLAEDRHTSTIILYIEGVKDGRRLLRAMKEVNRKKPVLVLKAGKGTAGQAAAQSHTGNIAGSYLAYRAAFRQAKVTEARNLDELFDLMRIFGQPRAGGNRIGIITNGGGLGVLTTDAVEEEGLTLATLGEQTAKNLKGLLPEYANIGNPLDLIADASVELYDKAIEEYSNDSNIDFIIICVLLQTPPMNEGIINVLTKAAEDKRKPVAVVSVGGAYTAAYRKILEGRGVPTFESPHAAIKAVSKFIEYSFYMKKPRLKKAPGP